MEQENYIEYRQDGDADFKDKRPRFIELIDHEIVEIACRMKLLIDQRAIVGNTNGTSRGWQLHG
jgi:hypothetical protein